MKRANLLACDFTGTFLATAAGKSLLLYSGEDGQPLWRGSCDGAVIGLGATDAEIVTLDDLGKLVWWDGESGQRADELTVQEGARALAIDADGVAAVLTKSGVQVLDPGDEPLVIPFREGRCVAWAEAGDRVAVGARGGVVAVFDGDTGKEIGACTLPAPVASLAWNAEGEWLATAGDTLYSVSASGRDFEELRTFRDRRVECLACSEDGSLIALRLSEHLVAALRYPELETAAKVSTRERLVTGVSFASRAWLAVGLDLGDASKISIRSGAVRHTEPHGDETRTWELDVKVSSAQRRSASAGRQGRAQVKDTKKRLARSEKELNTPDPQTLWMLGSVAAATAIMWGAAKFACNNHSPISYKPREVGTVELASTAKDAAIEMIHRLETYQFNSALELTEHDASRRVEEALRACEKDGEKACETKRAGVEGKVLTMAEVLTQSPTEAKARVTSMIRGGSKAVYDVELRYSTPIWKVVKFEKQG